MPEPSIRLEKAHDIRRLRGCARCKRIGDDRFMPKISRGVWMHGYCALAELGSVRALLKLPRDEINKLTLGELGAINMAELCDLLDPRRADD